MRCCASTIPAITVTTDGTSVTLERCGGCGDQRWLVAGMPVSRDQAFRALALAYGQTPLQARAARDRHASRTAARAAARVAGQSAVAAREPVTELGALLAGWTVLGASS